MARRRLLTLLAASAVLTGVVAGPAAALDIAPADVGTTAEAVEETVADVVEDVTSSPASAAVDAVADELPVETAPAATPNSSAPTAAPAEEPADTGESDDAVVAAGGVTSAPPIDLLVGLGGSERTVAPGAPLGAPAMAPATTTTDDLEAPMVAPAPAQPTIAAAPSALAQAIDGLPEEGAPALALVALAALLAAGAGTIQTARAEATA